MRLRSGREPNKERKVSLREKIVRGELFGKLVQLRLQLTGTCLSTVFYYFRYLQSDAKITFRLEKRLASSNILIHSHLLNEKIDDM
jgi:hypothetical protein